jgi:hypothetical protein
MSVISYRASIDPDVMKKYKPNKTDFQLLLIAYLNSPDGWTQDGYSFVETSDSPRVVIRLSSSSTVNKVCGISPNLSCAELGGRNMYLNAERWFKGAPKSGLNLENYRQYMVSHEMGHILGKGHSKCPHIGSLAPIMLQQTLGLHGCLPNTNVKK